MNISVNPLQIAFTTYSSLGVYGVALLACIFVLYIFTLCVNIFLVVVICTEVRLRSRPMYMLLVNLCLSGVMGSSLMCPNIISLLLHNQPIPFAGCLSHIFFGNVYAGCIFGLLALMAYDRYVSICKPLLYHTIMTPAKVRQLVSGVYVGVGSSSAIQMYLTSRLQLCGHTVDKLICNSLSIDNLSCTNTLVISVYGLCCAVAFIMLPCGLVILSYAHIFMVIHKVSKSSQRKALQTCTPHLVAFINFSMASFFGVINNRMSNGFPKSVNILISINFFVVPPLFHPFIYGIKMQEIRNRISQMMGYDLRQIQI